MATLGEKYFEKIVNELRAEKKWEKIVVDSTFKANLKNALLQKAEGLTNPGRTVSQKIWPNFRYLLAGAASLAVLTVAAFNFNNFKLLMPSTQYIPVQKVTPQPADNNAPSINTAQSQNPTPPEVPKLDTFAGASVMPPEEILHPQTVQAPELKVSNEKQSAVTFQPTVPSPNLNTSATVVPAETSSQQANSPTITYNPPQPLFGNVNFLNYILPSTVRPLPVTIPENGGIVFPVQQNSSVPAAPAPESGGTINSGIEQSGIISQPQSSGSNVVNQTDNQPSSTNNNPQSNSTPVLAPLAVLSVENSQLVNPVAEFQAVPPVTEISRKIAEPLINPIAPTLVAPPDLKQVTVIDGNLDQTLVQSLIKEGFADKLPTLNATDAFEVESLDSGKVKIRYSENGRVVRVVIFAPDQTMSRVQTATYSVVTSIQ